MAYNALTGTVIANKDPVFAPSSNGGDHSNAIHGEFHGEGLYLKNVARVVANDINDYVVTLGNQEQSLVGEPNLRFNGQRLYEFFEHQELQFLYDSSDDYYLAMERREAKRKNALRAILFEEHGTGEISSPAK